MGDASHHREVLFANDDLSVVDFRCRQHVSRVGGEEPNPTNSIAFVRRGLYQRSAEGRMVVADANHILFFNAAQPYRFAHPVEGGDDCTIVTISTPLALQAVRARSPRDAERDDAAPFAFGHAVRSPSTTRLQYELLHAVRNAATPLVIEDLLFELTDHAVRDACDTHRRAPERATLSPAAQRRRRELTEAAKVVLNRRLDSPPALHSLARHLGCSAFHLSRTFHATAGMSMRRYLSRLRATIAAHHLARGAADLTALALDLGYTDHSHFTNAFRREFGVPPSRFRAKHRK